MKYLIYTRVSPKGSRDSGETSITMQLEMCREYVKMHGGTIVCELVDEFLSGKDKNRPGLKRILTELEGNTAEWDAVVVYKLSRLTRSLRDGAELFELFYKNAKGFVSITENLDFSTPAGRAMLGILHVFNQFEREQTAENIRNKMINIAMRGEWPTGNPPFGYKRGAKGDNKLYVDPRRSEIVRAIFEMYSSDKYSTRDIISKYKDVTGGSTMSATLVSPSRTSPTVNAPKVDIELAKKRLAARKARLAKKATEEKK